MIISRLGHVALHVTDLESAATFHRRVLGLTERERGDGRVFLTAGLTTSFDLELIASDRRGLDHFAFLVASAGDLEAAHDALATAGVTVERLPAGGDPGIADGIRFALPHGVTMELALEAEPTVYVPLGAPTARQVGGIAPLPIDHVTLNVPGIDEVVAFVGEHLGFRLTEAVRPRPDFTRLAFTRCRDHHHDLAFIDPGHGDPAALNHVAFRVSSLEQLVRACDICAELGVTLDASPGRHMIGDHVYTYFRDPSGNRVELSWGMAKIDPAAETRVHEHDTFDLWREGFPPLMRA